MAAILNNFLFKMNLITLLNIFTMLFIYLECASRIILFPRLRTAEYFPDRKDNNQHAYTYGIGCNYSLRLKIERIGRQNQPYTDQYINNFLALIDGPAHGNQVKNNYPDPESARIRSGHLVDSVIHGPRRENQPQA